MDRCIFMEQGKIVREYTMEELARFTVEERMCTGIRLVHLSDFSPVKRKGLDAGQCLSMKNIQFAYKRHIALQIADMMQTAELISELRAPDIFMFVITHDYEFILSACEEVIQIENGKLKEQYCLNEEGISKLQKFYVV